MSFTMSMSEAVILFGISLAVYPQVNVRSVSKTNVIPEREIKIALTRMRDFNSRYPEGNIPWEEKPI